MVNINCYMENLIPKLKDSFGKRLIYVGLQGSYMRNEATDESDIDIMTVIEDMSVDDLAVYRSVIKSMPGAENSCGFICSKEDLQHWNRLESFHCLNGTKDYFGVLRDLLPAYTKDDIKTFLRVSINNLYHSLCHTFVHRCDETVGKALPGLYKQTFFILQGICALENGAFINSKAELVSLLSGTDRTILEKSIQMSSGLPCHSNEDFLLLFTWCRETMKSL